MISVFIFILFRVILMYNLDFFGDQIKKFTNVFWGGSYVSTMSSTLRKVLNREVEFHLGRPFIGDDN